MEEQKYKMDLFDRFIDEFSLRELKSRVWAVVLIGVLLSGLAIGGVLFLATRTFHIADEPGLESVPFGDLLKKGSEH